MSRECCSRVIQVDFAAAAMLRAVTYPIQTPANLSCSMLSSFSFGTSRSATRARTERARPNASLFRGAKQFADDIGLRQAAVRSRKAGSMRTSCFSAVPADLLLVTTPRQIADPRQPSSQGPPSPLPDVETCRLSGCVVALQANPEVFESRRPTFVEEVDFGRARSSMGRE